MLRNLTLTLLFAASAGLALASLQFSDKTTTLILKPTECSSVLIKNMVPDEYKASLFDADVTFQGRKIKACWTDLGEAYGIVDEEGDAGAVPKNLFKEMGV